MRQAPPASALRRAIEGEDADWQIIPLLLAEAVDALHISNWMNSKDGQRNVNQPKPIPRPGTRPEKEDYAPLPVDEMLEWLGWEAPDNAAELDGLAEDARTTVRGSRKLTPDQVRIIRAGTDTRAALAARFGVSASTVSAVAAGRTYRDID